MEFYFSDSNLPRDKFLLEKIGENPEVGQPDPFILLRGQMPALAQGLALGQRRVADEHHAAQGDVDLALLCSFKRMAEALGIAGRDKDGGIGVSEAVVAQARPPPPKASCRATPQAPAAAALTCSPGHGC